MYPQPSRCSDEQCNENRVRIAPKERLPCLQPAKLSDWFEDESVSKHQVFNITLFALDDLIFKVEVHLLHGLFLAAAPFFRNSASIQLFAPNRAYVTQGLRDVLTTRRLSPFVSFEERYGM